MTTKELLAMTTDHLAQLRAMLSETTDKESARLIQDTIRQLELDAAMYGLRNLAREMGKPEAEAELATLQRRHHEAD